MRVTGSLRRQRPLPLVPADARRIAPGVDVVEDADGGVVFLEGMASWCWEAGDEAGRRLAMVGLVDAKAARHREVAAGFGCWECSETTLWRHRQACACGGAAALTPQSKGPRRASKLTPEIVARIRRARERGAGLAAIADAEGIARSSHQGTGRRAGHPTPPQTAAALPTTLTCPTRPCPRRRSGRSR